MSGTSLCRAPRRSTVSPPRKAAVGNILTIACYAVYSELELQKYAPNLVYAHT